MSLLKAVPPEQSPDNVRSLSQAFMDSIGAIPPSFKVLGSSPGLQSVQAELIDYYRQGSGLGTLLQTLIRYLTASVLKMGSCVDVNARALAALGLTEEQITAMLTNPASAPIDEKEGWLLALVIKAVAAPETVSLEHVEKLRDLGWTDADIIDALYLACMMVGMERLMRALKVES